MHVGHFLKTGRVPLAFMFAPLISSSLPLTPRPARPKISNDVKQEYIAVSAQIVALNPDRFSRAHVELVRRALAMQIATGRIALVERVCEEDGDAIHVSDADGDPVCSFAKEHGKVRAVDSWGLVVAEAARVEDVVEGVREWAERIDGTL